LTDRPPKDLWDKIGIVLQPVGGMIAALAVGVVGFMGSHVLERRQSVDTNARLYSELMSRREESESALRKDMFVSIIQSFLRPGLGDDVDTKILNLELLAYNFHESLDLKPLFQDIARNLRKSSSKDKDEQLARLNHVARDITDKQLFALEGNGKSFRRTVDLDEVRSKQKMGGVSLDPESLEVRGKKFEVGVRVVGFDPNGELRVRLAVRTPTSTEDTVDTRATFNVGFFDFPLIDNTRLANGMRCAVTLSALSQSNADLTTICFPGEYASLKDRPYYDEVIQQLRDATGDSVGTDESRWREGKSEPTRP
jgi:hypothetical protein